MERSRQSTWMWSAKTARLMLRSGTQWLRVTAYLRGVSPDTGCNLYRPSLVIWCSFCFCGSQEYRPHGLQFMSSCEGYPPFDEHHNVGVVTFSQRYVGAQTQGTASVWYYGAMHKLEIVAAVDSGTRALPSSPTAQAPSTFLGCVHTRHVLYACLHPIKMPVRAAM